MHEVHRYPALIPNALYRHDQNGMSASGPGRSFSDTHLVPSRVVPLTNVGRLKD